MGRRNPVLGGASQGLTPGGSGDSVGSMGTTKKELVEDLWKKPYSLKRAEIEKRAKRGDYHDFDSELAAPKITLVDDLRAAGFGDLAQKAIDGAYDDERPSVEQIEEMRQELGPELFDQIMDSKPRGSA